MQIIVFISLATSFKSTLKRGGNHGRRTGLQWRRPFSCCWRAQSLRSSLHVRFRVWFDVRLAYKSQVDAISCAILCTIRIKFYLFLSFTRAPNLRFRVRFPVRFARVIHHAAFKTMNRTRNRILNRTVLIGDYVGQWIGSAMKSDMKLHTKSHV
jgi:hypothetical protein